MFKIVKRAKNKNPECDPNKLFFYWYEVPTDKQIEEINKKLAPEYVLYQNEDGWFARRPDGWEAPDEIVDDGDRWLIRPSGWEGFYGKTKLTHTPKDKNPIVQHSKWLGWQFAIRDGIDPKYGQASLEAALNDKMYDARAIATWVHGKLQAGNPLYVDNTTGEYVGEH